MASRFEQNLRLKTLCYLLFIPANFISSAVWLPHGQLLAVIDTVKQYHSDNVNHCIWTISFWSKAGMGWVAFLYLTERECSVNFDHHNAITSQIAKNTLPGLKPSFSKM